MGKKGFSRKAFLKPNKVSTDVESEDTPSQPNKVAEGQQKTSNAAVQDPSNEQPQAANDPSNRFLVTLNDEEKTTDPVSAGEDKESFTVSSGVHVDFSSNNGETSHEGETRGQMLQRHKKVLRTQRLRLHIMTFVDKMLYLHSTKQCDLRTTSLPKILWGDLQIAASKRSGIPFQGQTVSLPKML